MGKLVNIKPDIKQHGHRQAMTKTFLRLKTRPEEYTPQIKHCQYNEVTHCDLCGAALIYSFNLIHAEDLDFSKKLSLKVGADCIYNFCQIYMPSSAEQILHTIEESLATSKISKFKNENPEIFNQVKEIKNQIKILQSEYGYTFTSLSAFKNFTVWSRELNRSLYLSKPKVEKIENLFAYIHSDTFKELLTNHKTKPQITINEYLNTNPKDKKFYDLYKHLYQVMYYYPLSDQAIICSELEKMIFCENITYRINSTKSKPWVEQITQYPELAAFLLSGNFDRYSLEANAQNHFKKLIALSPSVLNQILKSDNFIKKDPKLAKLPKVWHNIINCLTLGKIYEI